MGKTKVDLTGQRRGKLLILSENFDKKRRHWNCICDCGATRVVRQDALKPGGTESCGECIYDSQVSYSSEYIVWIGIKARCNNPNHANYHNYGGRGISICDEWKNDFNKFFEYVGPRPDNHNIDRIDPNGNYEPGNVRWVDKSVSAANTRLTCNNSTGHKSVYLNKNCPNNPYYVQVDRNGKKHQLGFYPTIEEAIKARNEFYKQVGY